MGTTLRLKGGRGRGFRHAGFELDGKSWTPVEIVTDDQRQALCTYRGSHILLHPEDVAKLKALGIELGDDPNGPLVDTKKKPAAKPADKPAAKPDNKPAAKPQTDNSKAGAPATGGDEKKG